MIEPPLWLLSTVEEHNPHWIEPSLCWTRIRVDVAMGPKRGRLSASDQFNYPLLEELPRAMTTLRRRRFSSSSSKPLALLYHMCQTQTLTKNRNALVLTRAQESVKRTPIITSIFANSDSIHAHAQSTDLSPGSMP